MTKLAVMPIYGLKTFKILFPGISGSISMKLGMKHQRFKLIIFCSNDKNNRKAMNRNWSNQKANLALKTKAGNK